MNILKLISQLGNRLDNKIRQNELFLPQEIRFPVLRYCIVLSQPALVYLSRAQINLQTVSRLLQTQFTESSLRAALVLLRESRQTVIIGFSYFF